MSKNKNRKKENKSGLIKLTQLAKKTANPHINMTEVVNLTGLSIRDIDGLVYENQMPHPFPKILTGKQRWSRIEILDWIDADFTGKFEPKHKIDCDNIDWSLVKPFLTLSEIGELLHLRYGDVYKLLKNHSLPPYLAVGAQKKLWTKMKIQKWVESL